MKTYLDETDFDYSNETYNYQHELTLKLDNSDKQKASQELINEIVLWKTNRYVQMEQSTLDLLNSTSINSKVLDEDFSRKLLSELLGTKGIRLAMASTILRFRNPNIYQIIDQRAYRFAGLGELKLPTNHEEQIILYFDYLKTLRDIANKNGFDFHNADRILYQQDKLNNKDEKINW